MTVAPGVPTSPYLTTSEAADYIRHSVGALDQWAYQGSGPKFSGGGHGRKRLYRIEDIDRWLESRTGGRQ